MEGNIGSYYNVFLEILLCIDEIDKREPGNGNGVERVLDFVYPCLLMISCFFIFLTLLAYIFIGDLREPLFGKLVVGFLVNVCLNYFFNGIIQLLPLTSGDHSLSPLCYFLGYVTHHTFVSFFLWMNAMAITISRKLTQMRLPSSNSQSNKFFLIFLYAQGLPALLSLTIAVIDTTASCDGSVILPNMAKYNCFLSSNDSLDEFKILSPIVLYYYLIILLIVICNIACFIYTGAFLTSHMRSYRGR